LVCQQFAGDGQDLRFERQIEVQKPWWPFRTDLLVADVDATSGSMLVQELRDDPFCAKWHLVDLEDGGRTSLGCGTQFRLFMAPGPSARGSAHRRNSFRDEFHPET
jgi:hypothetical protein